MSGWAGPSVRVAPERAAAVDWRIASTAGVFAPLPGALLAALAEGAAEAAVTNLISLTFPMTLIVAGLFLLAREHGLIGWLSFLAAGAAAAATMYFVLRGAVPPADFETLESRPGVEPAGPGGALLRFLLPGLLTAAAFWLVVRLAYPAVYQRAN